MDSRRSLLAIAEHTLDCLRRINCRHLHLIIGNHDRNFRLRSNDALYENVFETIDDYRESTWSFRSRRTGKPTAATTRQIIGMSLFSCSRHWPKHGNWPENWNKLPMWHRPPKVGCSMVIRIKQVFQTAPIRSEGERGA